MVDPDDVTTAAERSAYAKADPDGPGATPASADAAGTDASPAAEGEPASPVPASPPPAAPPPPASSGPAEPTLLETLPLWTVPAILLAVPLLIGLAVQVDDAVYDDVVWKYYWGPIKADAENVGSLTHDGVEAHSGYNLVNTLSWAVLLGLCIFGIAQMLVRFRTPMDDKLIVAATAWVVVGSAAHVLEDAGLFDGWLQYIFITPPIYLLFGAFGIASFLVGQWMKKVEAVGGVHAALRLLWILHAILVLAWTGLWMKDWPGIVVYVNPLWVAGFAVVNFVLARHFVLRAGKVDPSLLTLLLSAGTYLLVAAYIVSYIVDPWSTPSDGAMPSSSLVAPALALAVTGLVLLLAKKAPKAILGILLVGASVLVGVLVLAAWNVVLVSRLGLPLPEMHGLQAAAVVLVVATGTAWRIFDSTRKTAGPGLTPTVAAAYALGINLLIVFAQMLDAFATSLGIDLANYREKHVLSAQVIDAMCRFSGAEVVDDHCAPTGDEWFAFGATYPTFLAFAPVKLIVSLLVIYAIDVQSKDDPGRSPTLIGLVKFAIIMVGIGPGVRDFVRLSLGV